MNQHPPNKRLSQKELYELACQTGHSFCTDDPLEIKQFLKLFEEDEKKSQEKLMDKRDIKTRLSEDQCLDTYGHSLENELKRFGVIVEKGILNALDLKSYKDV